MQTKNICVFCASSKGTEAAFINAARETGRMIARNGWILLYGGACCGLMGEVADSALEEGGIVHGIIPDFFEHYDFEVIHPALTRLVRVPTMAKRKELLIAQADAFVTLPGSYGTLDELFETLVLQQLKQIDKPVFLLDAQGFYAPLLQQLARMQDAGFLHKENRKLLQVVPDVADLEKALCETLGANGPSSPCLEKKQPGNPPRKTFR